MKIAEPATLALAYCPFPGREEAERVSRILVEEKLTACANILGNTTSIYRWQGEIETSAEVTVLYKTTIAAADSLIARLAALHSYDEPAILCWNVDAAPAPFAAWIEAQTS